MDVLAWPLVGPFLRWRHARTVMQLPLFAVAVFMIWHGFTGPSLGPKNIAIVFTWIHYRGFVILALLLAGNLFCMACPFMLPRNLARRVFSPRWMWPAPLRNKWLAVGVFGAFLFVYEYFDLWALPFWTAVVILLYFTLPLILDGMFRGAPFCKYVCPIGQFNFLASTVSPLEVKVREPEICAHCTTKDCIRGNSNARGCELWLFQPRKVGNLDCTFCLDCIHACPYDNVGIQARVPGEELWSHVWRSGIGRLVHRPDMGFLGLLFTFGALLNAFGMVSPVYALEAWLQGVMRTTAEWAALGVIFLVGLILEPAVLVMGAAWLSRRWSGGEERLLRVANRYVWSIVPLGIGIWAAHYTFHFIAGFWAFVPVIQNTLWEWGLKWLGEPRWNLGPLVPMGWLFPVELGFLLLGTVGSLITLYQMSVSDFPDKWRHVFAPWAALIFIILGFAIWLLYQPMEMRGMICGG